MHFSIFKRRYHRYQTKKICLIPEQRWDTWNEELRKNGLIKYSNIERKTTYVHIIITMNSKRKYP